MGKSLAKKPILTQCNIYLLVYAISLQKATVFSPKFVPFSNSSTHTKTAPDGIRRERFFYILLKRFLIFIRSNATANSKKATPPATSCIAL